MIEQLSTIFESYAAHWGYLAAFLILLAENSIFLGAFVPGETVAFISGFYASQGIISPYWVAVAIAMGAILGDNLGFLLGRKKGKKWLAKIGKFFGYREEKIDRAELFWKDHGPKAIFMGRFMAVARTFVPFLSGASKVKYRTFLIYDIYGAVAWSIIHVAVGYFFGANWKVVKTTFGSFGVILFFVFVITIYRYLVKKGVEKVEDK